MPADAEIIRQRGKDEPDPLTLATNQIGAIAVMPGMNRKPEYYIYVFNIGAKAWVDDANAKLAIRRPPLMPCVSIPGCPKGKPYVLAFRLPDIVRQGWQDETTGGLRIHEEYGARVAMDIINPVNPTLDQDLQIDPNIQAFAQGFNLGAFGVFWSKNEVPTEEELNKAKGRMERQYRKLLVEADELERAGQRSKLTPDHYLAGDYFGYKANWRSVPEVPDNCPNCGAGIKRGAAYHRTEDGVICVVDWKRTVAAGVKTKADVPEELRWWEPKKKAAV